MLGHTRKRPIEDSYRRMVESHEESDRPMSLDEFIQEHFEDLPYWSIALKGFRCREGLSQASLGSMLGIAQTNISQMELGKRPIGKTLAKKFADFFKTDYHLFL